MRVKYYLRDSVFMWLVALAAICLFSVATTSTAQARSLDNLNRERGRLMLNNVKNEIKKSYYDPGFHGIDVDARFKAAEEKLKQATSVGQVFGIIAQAVLDLNDSHTFFIPPSRSASAGYGWQMQMIGDKCYVVAVKPGSDAEARGLKVGDEKRRKETKPLMAKSHDHPFKGKLVVLVDSESGSSAELFARMVQLEKLGAVIGDRTAGAVMAARHYEFQIGNDTVVFYGASITAADLIMTDGKSLEGVGVTPDKLVVPTASDLAAKLDPALAHAAELVGYKIDPGKAGTMFPIEWRK